MGKEKPGKFTRERVMMPIHEKTPTGKSKLVEDYFAGYRLISNVFNLSAVFLLFAYYVFCALNLFFGFVLFLYVCLGVTGRYIGETYLSYVIDVIRVIV